MGFMFSTFLYKFIGSYWKLQKAEADDNHATDDDEDEKEKK